VSTADAATTADEGELVLTTRHGAVAWFETPRMVDHGRRASGSHVEREGLGFLHAARHGLLDPQAARARRHRGPAHRHPVGRRRSDGGAVWVLEEVVRRAVELRLGAERPEKCAG